MGMLLVAMGVLEERRETKARSSCQHSFFHSLPTTSLGFFSMFYSLLPRYLSTLYSCC